jgi:hypothetical protein
MLVPGFTAERALHQSAIPPSTSWVGEPPGAAVIPAIPSCGQCETICDRCWDCIGAGGTFGSCRSCVTCNFCSPRSCGGGGGGGSGGSCDLRCGEARADCYRVGTDTVICENRFTDCLWSCW